MESCLAGADEWRGGAGPLVLERGPAESPLFQAFFEAVQQAGYPLTDDVNGFRQEGFAAFDRNIHDGRRLSAARAYLHPVMHRQNLDVRCRTFVNRVVFDGTRAVGVDVAGRVGPERIEAGEVILCGGAINSPQLLQLSGVGTRARARDLGVDVVHDLPGSASTCRTTRGPHPVQPEQPVSVAPALSGTGSRLSASSGFLHWGRAPESLRGRRVHPQTTTSPPNPMFHSAARDPL
jgi:choline dehydrogenase